MRWDANATPDGMWPKQRVKISVRAKAKYAALDWSNAGTQQWKKGNPHRSALNTTMGQVKQQGGAIYLEKDDKLRKYYPHSWGNARDE